MARIAKKHIKEDKLLSTTAKISVFLEKQWKNIAAGAVAIIILIAAIFLYTSYINSRNEKAARNFDEAKVLYDEAEAAIIDKDAEVSKTANAKYEEAGSKFKAVSQKGGHSDTISKSLFYSAKCSYKIGNYNEAVSGFESFARKYGGSMLSPHVQRLIGHCYEQLGGTENLRKAIQQYDKVSKYPETRTTMEVLIDKGRCYEKLSEWDKATASYESITSQFKQKVELAIQNKSKELLKSAKDVISKYDTAVGSGQASEDFTKFVNEAQSYEGKQEWFEALKAYDKAIASQKKFWGEKTAEVFTQASQNATSALREYESLSLETIKNVINGQKVEADGDWDGASRFYARAVTFDFLPDRELFDSAQFRLHWLNSIK